MLDIHAHLHDSAFDADRDEVIRRAEEASVKKIITIGTNLEESRKAIACAEKYGNVYASVGIHPEYFNMIEENTKLKSQSPNKAQNSNHKVQKEIEVLKSLAKHEKVVAIGECGLDYYSHGEQAPISNQQKELQKELFLAQIEVAQELNLPLIIHIRPSVSTMDAYEDLFLILQSKIKNLKSTVLHCYMGDTEVTKKFLMLPNVHFSFTGNITYPVKKIVAETKDDLTQVVNMIPIERVLAETDCPYLAPQLYRGKRNEPAYVVSVAEKISEIKGISAEEVRKITTLNAENIFGLV